MRALSLHREKVLSKRGYGTGQLDPVVGVPSGQAQAFTIQRSVLVGAAVVSL